MVISYRYKFIFIHNYKVAGSSVTDSLKGYGLIDPIFSNKKINCSIERIFFLRFIHNHRFFRKFFLFFKILSLDRKINFHSHIKGSEMIKIFSKEIWNSFYKFGFVRNPWDWQVSLYFFMLKNQNHHQHKLIKSMKSFDEYIKWRVEKDLHLQKEFFYDKNGNRLINFMGKFENLEKDFNKICKKIGISSRLPHKNKSKRKNDYREYYNKKTKELIRKKFKEDIELFGY